MINQIFNWIVENKEWFFSGIGVTIILGIGGLVRKWFVKNRDREETIKIEQKNEGEKATQIGIQNNYYGGSKNDR